MLEKQQRINVTNDGDVHDNDIDKDNNNITSYVLSLPPTFK